MNDFFKGLVQHKQNMELIKGLQELTASEAIAEDALKEIASLKQQLAEQDIHYKDELEEGRKLRQKLAQVQYELKEAKKDADDARRYRYLTALDDIDQGSVIAQWFVDWSITKEQLDAAIDQAMKGE